MSPSLRSILTALTLLVGPVVQAQEYYLRDGSDLFQAWLKLNGVEPISLEDIRSGNISPAESILIVWSTDNSPGMQMHWQSTAKLFLESGGAVLIASNEPCDLGFLIGRRSLSFVRIGEDHPSPSEVEESQRVDFFPGLRAPFDVLQSPGRSGTQPLGSVRSPQPAQIQMLWREGPFQVPIAQVENRRSFFAYAGEGPRESPYRFLVLADQGVLSNGMMLTSQPNYQFAWNTVKFLRGPTNRSKCLFLDRGRVVESFPLEFVTPPPPDVPVPLPGWRQLQFAVTDAANRIMDRLETNDAINRTLLGHSPPQQNERLAKYLQFAAMMAVVCAVIYLLSKVWKSRQPQDPALTTTRAGGPPANSVLGRRGQELLFQDNLGELAASEARDFFHEMRAPHVPGSELPSIEHPHGDPADLHRQISRLWRLGFGNEPVVVKAAQWKEFEATLATVRQAAADGHWRFANPSSPS